MHGTGDKKCEGATPPAAPPPRSRRRARAAAGGGGGGGGGPGSPPASGRLNVTSLSPGNSCAAGLDVCESRDPKGLYAKARAGVIKEFTGISSPYEAPEHPELTIDTGAQELSQSVALVINALQSRGVIPVASHQPAI